MVSAEHSPDHADSTFALLFQPLMRSAQVQFFLAQMHAAERPMDQEKMDCPGAKSETKLLPQVQDVL